MNSGRKRRSFRSIGLTRKHHFHYLGLWMLISAGLAGLLGAALALVAASDPAADPQAAALLLWGIVFATVIVIIGIVYLSRITAHRIAGPYVQLVRVCNAVRDGNFAARLKFRDYDKLEDVEAAFAAMMDTVQKSRMSPPPGHDKA